MDALAKLSLAGQERRLIVGIDFGTTYSGVAWGETRRPDQQTIVNMWPSSLGTHEGKSADKVPTELRYTHQAMEWGFQIPPFVERHHWFKLGLIGEHPTNSGQLRSPETLTADYLTALYNHLMYTLEQKLGASIVRTIPIEFCLTVPAIWSEVAKEKTSQACKNADLKSKANIMLVSEPEAAATYALHELDPHGLKIGDSFVLCDAGGGTVDLISYTITQLQPMLKVVETVPGTGGLCGSTFLNRRFSEFLTAKLEGKSGWDDELLAEAMERFDLVIKRQYSPSTSDQNGYTILVPGMANNEILGIRRGRLLITPSEMREIFEPVISEVISLVEEQIKSSGKNEEKIRAVLLVGGFGENTYLKERLRAVLSRSIEVMQPPNAWTAVVRGAVMMGLGRVASELTVMGVTSRAARKHYGMELRVLFDSTKHEESKKFYSEKNKEYRVWCMYWFIRRGDPVEENEPRKIDFFADFLVSNGKPKSTVLSIKCDEISLTAPVHKNSNVRELVSLEAHLGSLSNMDVEATRKKLPDGNWYYHIAGAVEATYLSASTKYTLLFGNKRYNTVTAEYV